MIDPATGDIFVATGNGPYDGKTNWADSLIELDPGATHVLANYTPADNATLANGDLDLGSTSPVLLGAGVLAQGGKDMLIRTLSLSAIAAAAPHSGGELQNVSTPSKSMLFTALAVWQDRGKAWTLAPINAHRRLDVQQRKTHTDVESLDRWNQPRRRRRLAVCLQS